MSKDLLTFAEHTPEQLLKLLTLAAQVKALPNKFTHALEGKSIVGIFEKPSLRTRVTFDIGIFKLGGQFVYLDSQNDKLGQRESLKDMGNNLSCWADAIVARVFSHETLEGMADASSVPVINALCDKYHPCQALADYLAIQETFGDARGVKLAYVGDGNNVTHSLMIVGAILGCDVRVVTPKGYEVADEMLQLATKLADQYGGKITASNDLDTLNGVQVIYTDTWISMGDNTKYEDIKDVFEPYQVNQAMLDATGAEYVMHCQPAHREQEITSEVMDGDQSLLLVQAENRMHAQNAILISLLS